MHLLTRDTAIVSRGNRFRSTAVPLLGALTVLVAQWAMAQDAIGPSHVADEVAHAANSAYLQRGVTWQLDGGSYAAGWSAMLAPIWLFTHEPVAWYRAALVLTALVGVAVFVASLCILRLLSLRWVAATAAAVALSLAPGRLIFGGYILSENLVALMYLAVLIAVFFLQRQPSKGSIMTVAILGGVAPFVHARLLPLLLATTVLLVVGLAKRSQSRVYALAIAVQVTLFGGGQIVNRTVEAAVYRDGSRTDGLSSLLDSAQGTVVAQLLIGHLWYGAVAWVGLSILGLAVISSRAVSELRRREFGVYGFLLLTSAGTLVLAVAYLAPYASDPSTARPDYFVYGRYGDPVWYVLSLFGLVRLVQNANRSRDIAVAVVMAAGTAAAAFVVGTRPVDSDVWVRINAAGIEQWPIMRGSEVHIPYGAALAGALAVFAALSVTGHLTARRFPSSAAVGIAVILGAYFSWSSHQVETQQLQVTDYRFQERLFSLRHPLSLRPDPEVLYQSRGRMPTSANGYQYWLGDRLRFFSEGAKLSNAFVIARKDWSQAHTCGCSLIIEDRRLGDALYVAEGELNDDLSRAGWLRRAQGTDPLADGAYRDSWSIEAPSVTELRGETVLSGVSVRHSGTGEPWPAAPSVGSPLGRVRVVAWWEPRGRRLPVVTELPRSVVPTDQVEIDVSLRPPADLVPGEYDVGIGLVHEGVRSFAPPGSEPVRLRVVLEHDGDVLWKAGPFFRGSSEGVS
jgi:hypothetical protein